MATEEPISAFTALGGAPATNDLFVVVDVSDTTEASTGTTKNATMANVFTSPTFTGTVTAPAVNATSVTSTGPIAVSCASAQVTVDATSGNPQLIFQKVEVQQGGWSMSALSTMNLLDNGGATVATFTGGALNITGNLSVATNKFTVASATGNTAIAGAATAASLAVTGAATAASLAVTGGLTSSGPTGAGVGYATGAGGTVTQITSINTGVTINTLTGTISMFSGTFNAQAGNAFVVTNSTVAATDTPIVVIKSGGNTALVPSVLAVSAGSFTVNIANVSTGGISATLVLSFSVIKGVAA